MNAIFKIVLGICFVIILNGCQDAAPSVDELIKNPTVFNETRKKCRAMTFSEMSESHACKNIALATQALMEKKAKKILANTNQTLVFTDAKTFQQALRLYHLQNGQYPLDATEAQRLRYDLGDTGVRLLSYVNTDGFVSVKIDLKDTSNCVEFSLDNEVGVVIDIRPCR